MGVVSSADQSPGGTSTVTVEQSATATQSYGLSTDVPLAVAHMQKQEVVRKPVIVQQPTALVPFSEIRTGGGILFSPSDQPHQGTDNRLAAAVYRPIPTRTRSTNTYDVTQCL